MQPETKYAKSGDVSVFSLKGVPDEWSLFSVK